MKEVLYEIGMWFLNKSNKGNVNPIIVMSWDKDTDGSHSDTLVNALEVFLESTMEIKGASVSITTNGGEDDEGGDRE